MKLCELLSLWWKPSDDKAAIAVINLAEHMTAETLKEMADYLLAVMEANIRRESQRPLP